MKTQNLFRSKNNAFTMNCRSIILRRNLSTNRQLCKFLPKQDKIAWTTYQRHSYLLFLYTKKEGCVTGLPGLPVGVAGLGPVVDLRKILTDQ